MKQNILIFILLVFSPVTQALELDARLNWAGHTRYGFAVNGPVVEVIAVGSKVKKNEVLAKLDSQPFNYKIKQYKASVNKFDPLVFDAKLEFDQANELFERTVLSEVELLKVEGKYKSLIAEQEIESAKLQMARWELRRASLKSRQDAYVLFSNILPGTIISDENKSNVYIELVSVDHASAVSELSMEQKLKLESDSRLSVEIDGEIIPARLHSIDMMADKNNQFKLVVVFKYTKLIEPGRKVKIQLM